MAKDWAPAFFRGIALEFWRRVPTETVAEVDFLEKALRIAAPSRLLDVPCGNGRHSLELARRGHSVTGVDLSEEYIDEAKAAGAGLDARWAVADMRQLSGQHFSAEFDGVFCFGNSFGYLNPAQARGFLAAVRVALKPGARFVMDTGMAAESILPNLQRTRWYQFGDIYMLSENRYDARESRLDIDYTFIQNGIAERRPSSSYVLTVNEICRMCEDASLNVTDLFGSFAGEAYQLGSPRLILVAEA